VTTHHRGLDINCNEVVEIVTAYLDGALDDATRLAFDSHLAICEGCELYVEQVRQTVAAIGQVSERTLSDEACRVLVEAFRGLRAG
jgi:anti-sigma factor RsiW